MSYYDSSENKIRRRNISYSSSYKNSADKNIESYPYKERNKKISRRKVDDDFDEIYYKERNKKNVKRNHLMKKSLTTLLIMSFIATVIAFTVVSVSLSGSEKITKELIYNSYVTKNVVPMDEMPLDLKNAIIATEDRRFYEHNGVDIRSLMRSVVNNVLSNSTQGGSTIDMQVSKNLLTCEDKTMKRKITDIYNAIQMNKIMTKDEILATYLNNIYFGKGSYGVANASQAYFGKDVRDLNLAECAMLAGITNNPAKFMQHDEGKIRQKVVLNNMYKQGYITKEQYDNAVNDPTPFKSQIA